MSTVYQGSPESIALPAGRVLSVVADAESSGLLFSIGNPGTEPGGGLAVPADTTTTVGPFASPRQYRLQATVGSLTFSLSVGFATDVGFANPMTTAGDTIVGGASGAPARQAKVMTAAGDLIIGGTAGAQTRLAKGTDGDVLTLVGGVPAWVTP